MRASKRVFVGAVVVALTSVLVGANAAPAAPVLDKRNVAIAAGTNGGFVVWEDWRNGDADIYGSRLDAAGKVLDPNGIPIATGAQTFAGQLAPDIAWNGTKYLVAWQVDVADFVSEIHYVYLDAAGTILGPEQNFTDNGAVVRGPSVAASGSQFLVVWRGDSKVGDDWIHGRLLPLDKDVTIESRPSFGNDPLNRAFRRVAVAGGSNGFLVAYERCVQCSQEVAIEDALPWHIAVTRVGLAGKITPPVALTDPQTVDELAPAVAWNGLRWLITWEDHRAGNADIYGSRLTSSGTNLDPGGDPIGVAGGGQIVPAATAKGSTFYVTWTDWRPGTTADIYGQRVRTTGALANGPGGYAVSTAPRTQRNSDVAPIGANVTAVWEDLRADSPDLFGANISATTVLTPNGFPVSQ